MSKRTTFPCPVCHGKGGWTDIVTDDGQGPTHLCGWCDNDSGQMVIGGENHREYILSSQAPLLLWRWHDGTDFREVDDVTINDAVKVAIGTIRDFWNLFDSLSKEPTHD